VPSNAATKEIPTPQNKNNEENKKKQLEICRRAQHEAAWNCKPDA